jgi:ABC-type branched-subunit amino acid transport system permease subunit
MVGLFHKIMCYAIAALAMDLIWATPGILSLGHELFLHWAAMWMACT